MNKVILKDNVKIENMIYEIRGKQVMLDTDLAKLYNTETKRINEAVNRNKEKFPERFAFRITENDSNALKSQFATSKGGARKGHTVFTEQGVAMLTTILKSPIAIETSIQIMDAFVNMRHFIINNYSLMNQLYEIKNIEISNSNRLLEHEIKINEILSQFNNNEKTNHIFFEGQIYDAYSLLIDILNESKKEIIIIDNYAGKVLFDILKNIKCNIKIVTKNIDEESIKKYNKQYNNIDIIISDKFHDRFIILDNKTLYHSGASFKDIGKKCFAISKIQDDNLLKKVLEEI